MDWGELALFALWLGAPIGFGVIVGEAYRIALRDELAEAKRLADKTYLELDKARFELEELQTALDHARSTRPTAEVPAVRLLSTRAGRHRLRESGP